MAAKKATKTTAKKSTSSSKTTKTTEKKKVEDKPMSSTFSVEKKPLKDTRLDTPVPEIDQSNKTTAKIIELFDGFLETNKGEILAAMFDLCFKINCFYDSRLIEKIIFKYGGEDRKIWPMYYIEIILKHEWYKGKNFRGQINRENFEKIYSEQLDLLSLSEDDKKNRQQIMSILGYDPFKEDAMEDRPQLYRDLSGMLTENMRKDVAKQKAAVEVVRNYMNITKYQQRVTTLMSSGRVDDETQKQIDQYLTVIARVQSSVNQTTKENGFTGGKTIGSNGRGMLSDVMLQVEEQGYDDGITNFYDIATSKSIGEVATISSKALLAQVKLQGSDYTDILTQQCQLVQEAQLKARKAVEMARLAKSKLTKEQLLVELENDYRKKGISEDEIGEFIQREYKLWNGK